MIALPRGYLSHSQIRLYGECPQKYRFVYVEELRARVNEKVFLGEMFHAAVEDFFNRQISGSRPDDATTVAAFLEAFAKAADERDIDWQVPRREASARGAALIRYFLAHIAPAIKPLMVEKELSAEIPGVGVILKGVIDLVEEDFSIVDFKTTTSKWSAGKARNSLQMVIYKYLFERCFGDVRGRLRYEVLVAKHAAHVRHQSLEVVPGPDDIDRLLLLVRHVAENIAGGVFYPQPNPFCAYCEFFAPCRDRNPGLSFVKNKKEG